jgi:UDP-N-acetylmuramoylalanine--D-glutamate ligase
LQVSGMPRRRALVVGLGRTGASVARFLAQRGWEVAVTDSRTDPPGRARLTEEVPDAAVFLGGWSEAALAHADELILSPGVALDEPFVQQAIARGIPVCGDVELFAREARAPVVTVTGSNGKSTVTTLVGLMAERAGRVVRIGGNLGTPALDLIEAEPPELFVLELSSFQLETTHSLKSAAAVVLNISPDHLDRYPSLDAYAAAKARVYAGCHVAVQNRADPRVMAMPTPAVPRVSFGTDAPPGAEDWGLRVVGGRTWLARGADAVLPVSELMVRGAHNQQNALAALALASAVHLPLEPCLAVLREFRGLPHRTEFVAERRGVAWLNDSKGTNVGATEAAVAGLDGPLVVILGGDGKGQDFGPLVSVLTGKARACVTLGRDAARIEQAIGTRLPCQRVRDMDEAVAVAAGLAQSGDTVLLSPACSSLDMFESFEHRGRAFAHAVRGLAP